MVSLRDEAWNELRVREQAGSDGAIRRISPSASSGCCCGDLAIGTLAMTLRAPAQPQCLRCPRDGHLHDDCSNIENTRRERLRLAIAQD